VTATDIDPDALAAIAGNAAANEVAVDVRQLDMESADAGGAQLVLAADVFYQRDLARVALAFLRAAASSGAGVLAADPGRAFVPRDRLTPVAAYEIPVLTAIEDVAVKTVTVFRLAGGCRPRTR
jgi:predicted nicotinamide N-methyase